MGQVVVLYIHVSHPRSIKKPTAPRHSQLASECRRKAVVKCGLDAGVKV